MKTLKRTAASVVDWLYCSRLSPLQSLAARIYVYKANIGLGSIQYSRLTMDSIKATVEPPLPPLSWICLIKNMDAQFFIGNKVEHNNTTIFEGAWDGDFLSDPVHESDFVFGSGAQIVNRGITFIPPKHGLESLFVLIDKKLRKIYVSNSLCFVLQRANLQEMSDFMENLSDNIHDSSNKASAAGVDKYQRLIAEDKRYKLLRMSYYNFTISPKGHIRIKYKNTTRKFSNFENYKKLLIYKTKSVIENAKSEHRSIAYRPISTVSKGYDSPAVSVIAKAAGVIDALTLAIKVYGYDDSGEDIARCLGMKLFKFGHVLSNDISNLNKDFNGVVKKKALEFIATDGIGDDVAFLMFEEKLKNKLYLTGTYGDIVWRMHPTIAPGLTKQVFEKSISEFRLRVGFINFPVIAIGAYNAQSIQDISNSAEMNNYNVSAEYNRPIPRRICEEAGIPREYFGMQKSASSPLITNHRELFREAVKEIMKRYERAPYKRTL